MLVFFFSKLSRFSISNLNGRDPMIVGHCWAMRDHGTEAKTSNFDCVTHSLKQIEKDYHKARGCILSLHFLLLYANNNSTF